MAGRAMDNTDFLTVKICDLSKIFVMDMVIEVHGFPQASPSSPCQLRYLSGSIFISRVSNNRPIQASNTQRLNLSPPRPKRKNTACHFRKGNRAPILEPGWGVQQWICTTVSSILTTTPRYVQAQLTKCWSLGIQPFANDRHGSLEPFWTMHTEFCWG